MPTIDSLLDALLRQSSLPAARALQRISGRGFENEIYRVELDDGRHVLLRRYPKKRAVEWRRAQFLAHCDVPAPTLLASTAEASLYEFVPGRLLGDLIELGRDDETIWRKVGVAFRQVHDVRFPSGLFGEIRADRADLRLVDPVEQMHGWIDEAVPGLSRRAPAVIEALPQLHDVVDRAADALRRAPAALGHGDVHMWNIILSDERAVLIDWDDPIVCDPAMGIALLDKHTWLFNGSGIPAAFFKGYGGSAPEPNTALHRVVQTLHWAGSSDWEAFERLPLPTEQIRRTRGWLRALVEYAEQIEAHIERLRCLV